MNESRIRKLIEIFRESGVDEMEYRESFWRGISLRLGRRRAESAAAVSFAAPAAHSPPPPTADPGPAIPPGAEAAPAPAGEDLHEVKSPMVGTFYRAPSPEAEPFASVGDRVRAGQTICIIEAMKIMNEIEADVDGEVVEIPAANAEPVEYGQPLFRIRPA